MRELLIASTNPGKLREMQAILQHLPISIIQPADIGVKLHVEEDGDSYQANASKKARAYCAASGRVTLADDSGLEVQVLGGAPGLFSARYSPKPGASDADRRIYLLQNLAVYPQPWLAHFHCTVVIATPAGKSYVHEGNCYGQVINGERGQNGFGYDPIFFLPQFGKTMAELDDEIKNKISHRALALMDALPSLQEIFKLEGS